MVLDFSEKVIRKIAVFYLLFFFNSCQSTNTRIAFKGLKDEEKIGISQRLIDESGLILFEMQLKGSPEFFKREKIEEAPNEPELIESDFEWFISSETLRTPKKLKKNLEKEIFQSLVPWFVKYSNDGFVQGGIIDNEESEDYKRYSIAIAKKYHCEKILIRTVKAFSKLDNSFLFRRSYIYFFYKKNPLTQ